MRPVTAEELEAFVRADSVGFGSPPPDAEELAEARRLTELDRTLAVFDDGRIVATAAALSLELTLPGLTTAPAAGIATVAVVPTHRRRGLLRALMARQLGDVRERGESVAVLYASEAEIYGRFGYGLASSRLAVEIDRRHAAVSVAPRPGARLRLLEPEEAATVLPRVFDQARLRQPGEVSRSPEWWETRLAERPGGDKAKPPFRVAHHPVEGQADGYASYRIESKWEGGSPRGRVLVDEVVAVHPEAEAALWRYLLSLDLTQVVEASRPVDDPLRWMLADARSMRVTALSDALWLRPVDIPAALGARRYPVAGRLVVQVTDDFCPDGAGTYELEGGPDGAHCRRSDRDPDLVMDVADLGALYLGGVAASTLARAGRVKEERPGALSRADAMFVSRPPPFCRTFF